nr:NADH dehydrogenase subunit 4 [Clymenella torquata]
MLSLWVSTYTLWMAASFLLSFLVAAFILTFLPYISSMNILATENLSLDSLSFPLILLTLWTSALMILASINILLNNQASKSFCLNILLLNLTLFVMFSLNNYFMFYIFFEVSLIPTLFLILGWGYQPERLQAGLYLVLYTVTASLPLLMSIIMIMYKNNSLFMFLNTYSPPTIYFINMWWIMSIMAFMVKMPLYTTHLWLPKAHVEAPVAGSMILAGILLKLGSYGVIRLATPFWWTSTFTSISMMFTSISVMGAIITGLICLRQPDLKALIAYSSVGHMGLIIAGFMSNTSWGWEASLTMMVAHGLCSSALFVLANMTYETTQSRSMFLNKGMLSMFPIMALWWFMMASANMGAPPSLNLVSEVSLLASILNLSKSFIIPMILSMFISGMYSLIMYTTTQHGTPTSYSNPLNLFMMRNNTILLLHAFPLFILILKMDLLISWLTWP